MENLTISQAAKAARMGVETIRFYERRGLIEQPPRPACGGARDYGRETLARLLFIAGARELGFSLNEIGELMALGSRPGTSCASVRDKTRAKRVDVQVRIDRLIGLRDALDRLIASCPGEGELTECSILGAIVDKPLISDIGDTRPQKQS